MPAVDLLLVDPRLTMANFAQDLFEQVHLRTKTGDFRAGFIGDEYHILIGTDVVVAKSKDEAWEAAFQLLFATSEVTPELRARMELEGSTVKEVDVQTAPLIEVLTEGGMTALGRATEQARLERKAILKKALPEFLASHGAFDSVESMLESLATELGETYSALEVQEARNELNL